MEEPRPTCPKIDYIKLQTELEFSVISEKLATFKSSVLDDFELVRDDNKQLRKYIEYLQDQNKDLLNEVRRLKETIEILED